MTGEMNQQRFKALLKETITLLCSNGLNFKSEFTIEAVIGITIDRESILLLSIQDTITNNAKSKSAPQLRQADRAEKKFTASTSGMLKPATDMKSPRNNQSDKHFEDIAIEIVPVLQQSEAFDHTYFEKCTDGVDIKLEQTEDSCEMKSDERLSPSCEDNQAKPNFASDEIFVNCAELQSLGSSSNGERRVSSKTQGVEKSSSSSEFQGVTAVSWTVVETSTLNSDLDINRTVESYAVEDTVGGGTSSGHPDSEVTAASSIGHISTSTIARPRRRRRSKLANNSEDMESVTGRKRKKTGLSPYQCKFCGTRLSTLHALGVHEATVHLGKYRYSCPNCGKGYTVLSNLRAHIACKHNKQKEFICGYCGREYGYKHSLKEHILLLHSGIPAVN